MDATHPCSLPVPQSVPTRTEPGVEPVGVNAAGPGGSAMGVCRSLSDFALAATDAALDPDHPTNATLRNRGVGLVPAVVATDDADRRAVVSACSLRAQFAVPYGWHVIDDGRRALVFDPSGEVQINLNLLPREGRSDTDLLDAIEEEARGSYAAPQFFRLEDGALRGLGIRGLADGRQSLEQVHLLAPGRYEDLVLRARVTATPERRAAACALAECLLGSMDFECFPHREPLRTVPSGKPAWWHEARRLEAAGKLKEAEATIMRAVDTPTYASCIAELYAERMVRLRRAGDSAGATSAYKEADAWNTFFASQVSPGDEGAAVSHQRDRFLDRLRKAYASDFVRVAI